MPGLIVACARDAANTVGSRRLRACCARLAPPNARAGEPLLWQRGGMTVALIDPPTRARIVDGGAYVGVLAPTASAWWRTGSPPPDGLYALCRHDDGAVEILSDAVATHTVWYAKTDQLFLASTSQRALVSLLGDFRLNRGAVSWMLSSGSLGPQGAWDERLERLPGDAVLRLDRRTWEMAVQCRPIVFQSERMSRADHVGALRVALDESFAALDIDDAEWVVPLSGGGDSRGLLLFLVRSGRKPKCLTYGSPTSLLDPQGDAMLARAVSEALGVEHEFFPLEELEGAEAATLRLYTEASEGRVDHIAAYTDGFEVWRSLKQSGVRGALRGDQAFGLWQVFSESDTRISEGGVLVSDFSPRHPIRELDLPPQTWPEELRRHPGESDDGYRDRVYHQFRLPVIMAALNQIKTSYIDVVSPLQTRRIIEAARAMPDDLRTEKRGFRELVTSLGPPVPFATHDSTGSGEAFLARPGTLDAVREALASKAAHDVIGSENVRVLLSHLRSAVPAPETRRHVGRALKRVLPKGLIRVAKSVRGAPPLSVQRLAFRAYLAATIAGQLSQDAGGPD